MLSAASRPERNCFKMDTVSLKHTILTGTKTVYFYEGEAVVTNGIVSIPKNRPEWIKRAWILGYKLNPKTGKPVRLEDIVPA